MFSYAVVCDTINDDHELQGVIDCQRRHDLDKWKETMKDDL